MKNGSLDYNYFGGGLVFMLYAEGIEDRYGSGRLRIDARFMKMRTELLASAGCLDSELL